MEFSKIGQECATASDICEFYPIRPDDPVCACGSDITGSFVCTVKYSYTCQWAVKRKKEWDDFVANNRFKEQ